MKIKATILAISLLAGSCGAALAQDAETAIPASVSAAIEAAQAICSADPISCEAAMAEVLAAIRAAGLEGEALQTALTVLASDLISIGVELPPEAQTQIAAALNYIVVNMGVQTTTSETLVEVIAAFRAGQGADVQARLASPS